MPLQIRLMEKQDITAVKEIAIESWHNTYEKIIPRNVQDDFLSLAYNENVLLKRMESTPFYIAEDNNRVVGFANFSQLKPSKEVELSAIYVLPKHKNKGIGSQLLKQGIQDIIPEKIFVSVETENEGAKNFYLAKDFVILDEFDELFNEHLLKTTRMSLEVKN